MSFTHRLLILIGTGVLGLAVFVAWLVGDGGNTDDRVQETGRPEQAGVVEQPGGAETGVTSVSDQADAADPEGGAGSGSAAADGPDDADTVLELSVAACARFEDGQTVAEFAAWFEDRYPGSEDEVAAMFRAVVAHALQEECPEVIPDG